MCMRHSTSLVLIKISLLMEISLAASYFVPPTVIVVVKEIDAVELAAMIASATQVNRPRVS